MDRKKLNDKAEKTADNLLGEVTALPYSWAILLVSHIAAFFLGAWLF